jgi:hypothetical protein
MNPILAEWLWLGAYVGGALACCAVVILLIGW